MKIRGIVIRRLEKYLFSYFSHWRIVGGLVQTRALLSLAQIRWLCIADFGPKLIRLFIVPTRARFYPQNDNVCFSWASIHKLKYNQEFIFIFKKKGSRKSYLEAKIEERERESKAEGYMLLERGRAQRRTLYNTTYPNIIN